MNDTWIYITVILGLLLIVFIIYYNMRDRKKYEENLNTDFKKSAIENGEGSID